MKHLLKQTLTWKPLSGYDENGDSSYTSPVVLKCRFVEKDYTNQEADGTIKQLHGKVQVMTPIKSDDVVEYKTKNYVVWNQRAKVDGKGKVLFYVLEVYKTDEA